MARDEEVVLATTSMAQAMSARTRLLHELDELEATLRSMRNTVESLPTQIPPLSDREQEVKDRPVWNWKLWKH